MITDLLERDLVRTACVRCLVQRKAVRRGGVGDVIEREAAERVFDAVLNADGRDDALELLGAHAADDHFLGPGSGQIGLGRGIGERRETLRMPGVTDAVCTDALGRAEGIRRESLRRRRAPAREIGRPAEQEHVRVEAAPGSAWPRSRVCFSFAPSGAAVAAQVAGGSLPRCPGPGGSAATVATISSQQTASRRTARNAFMAAPPSKSVWRGAVALRAWRSRPYGTTLCARRHRVKASRSNLAPCVRTTEAARMNLTGDGAARGG